MSTLRIYFWKEWREQRAGVLGILLMLPCIPLLIASMGYANFLDIPGLPEVGAAAGFIAAMFLIGTHLIPAGNSPGGTRLLRRMPGGLHRAFSIKLVFFVLALLGFALYGSLLGELTGLIRGDTVAPGDLITRHPVYLVAVPALCAALWIFAVSSWVPNGSLAFPVGLICCAVFCWPTHALFLPSTWSQSWYVPHAWEPALATAVSFAAALVSGWASYAFGLRYGDHRKTPALVGATVALTCVLPMWGWTAHRWDQVANVEVDDPGFHIEQTWLNDDQSEALVLSSHEDVRGRLRISRTETPHEGVDNDVHSYHLPAFSQIYRVDLLTGTWKSVAFGDTEDTYTLPEGFHEVGHWTDPAPECSELPDGAWISRMSLGWGHRVRIAGESGGVFDRLRDRYYSYDEIPPPPTGTVHGWRMSRFYVLRDFWLGRAPVEREGASTELCWFQLDPDTREWSSAAYMERNDFIRAVFSNGVLLISRDSQLLFLDPKSGHIRPAQVPSPEKSDAYHRGIFIPNKMLPFDSVTAISYNHSDEVGSPVTERIALLDPVQAKISDIAQPEACSVLEQGGPNSALILSNNRRIESLNLETGKRSVLFPRAK